MDSLSKDTIYEFFEENPHVIHIIRENPRLLLEGLPLPRAAAPSAASQLPSLLCFHSAPQPMRDRVVGAGAAALVVPLERAPKVFASASVVAFCGQTLRNSRILLDEEHKVSLEIDSLLPLNCYDQPYLPSRPGEPGIYISPVPRQDNWPTFEALLCSQTPKRSTGPDKWTYMGQYELLNARPLDPEAELAALSCDVKKDLIRRLVDTETPSEYVVRLRTRVYLRKFAQIASPSPQHVNHCLKIAKKNNLLPRVSYEDVLESIQSGAEKIYIFVLQPVGYDIGTLIKLEEAALRDNPRSETPCSAPAGLNRTHKRTRSLPPAPEAIPFESPTSVHTSHLSLRQPPAKRTRLCSPEDGSSSLDFEVDFCPDSDSAFFTD